MPIFATRQLVNRTCLLFWIW